MFVKFEFSENDSENENLSKIIELSSKLAKFR